jgi:hypothetical protein
MKTFIIFIVPFLFILFSCHFGSESVRDFIPGTYVKGTDTLVIARQSSQSNVYYILRKTSFQRVRNGKPQRRQYETEQWMGVYSEPEKIIRETRRGKILSFDPAMNRLYLERKEFTKIK